MESGYGIRFKAKWDRTVSTVTLAIMILLLSIAVLIFLTPIGFVPKLAIIILLLIIAILPYLWAPKAYLIKDHAIIVERPIGSFKVKYIETPEKLKSLGKLGFRLWASGGLYGYFGLFYIRGKGNVWVYATHKDRLLFIKSSNGKKYIISPYQRDEFLKNLTI